ncbi:hypothetical protein FisN_18Lh015 [Fistulifera solaris]|uniref:Uncharacterized protein n=1 Tax=Fistulifera solaris TaxID=1519565 RepID=A0A1Z5K215_FISSO|nr:hypothetical protein FisN_18Lh015 [Fistulifera solaris]|eukprot:GAX20081.1 hypothetical protein FisN_18Lh015 [Fistulifera solaris]
MKFTAAYLGLCLFASAEAAQFTQSFLEYQASGENRGGAFEEMKTTMTASYGSRRLTHTLPPFIVPRECNYSAINHTPTSTNPIDQFVCPDRCGTGRTFTLRIASTCDGPYDDAGTTCSAVIQCGITGCTNGLSQCPPIEIVDFNSAIDEACDVLCDAAPAPTPVAAPVPVPVAVPVPQPVVSPVGPPVAIPTPVSVPTPLSSPVAIPTPVSPTLPTPISTPVSVPTLPTPIGTPVFVPSPVSPPVLGPISGKRTGNVAAVNAPISVPLSTLSSPVAPVAEAPVEAPVETVEAATTESGTVRGSSSTTKSTKSKKSKSSSYCDDSANGNKKRCLKRKST